MLSWSIMSWDATSIDAVPHRAMVLGPNAGTAMTIARPSYVETQGPTVGAQTPEGAGACGASVGFAVGLRVVDMGLGLGLEVGSLVGRFVGCFVGLGVAGEGLEVGFGVVGVGFGVGLGVASGGRLSAVSTGGSDVG